MIAKSFSSESVYGAGLGDCPSRRAAGLRPASRAHFAEMIPGVAPKPWAMEQIQQIERRSKEGTQ